MLSCATRQVERIVGAGFEVIIAFNQSKGTIVVNDTTPLVLVHRMQMPILERVGASYDLMVEATENMQHEIAKMDRKEIPSKVYTASTNRWITHSPPPAPMPHTEG